ncbi:hypothetical protein Bca52824_018070 [Brassica carinata]|uniref:Uncharacterized protein n=1 Tax=Brassica carinata TaxID=52824 RepID=A0A8X8AY55_BRACI|nr:hypothetical protein Bca52824_018070 [Brassica carinata]
MNRKCGDVQIGYDTAKQKRKEPFRDMPNLQANHRFCNPNSLEAIPLTSIYYRLFKTIDNHKVPSYTIPTYQQISKLSPQTPLNKRRCILGLDKMKDQVTDTPDTPSFQSCLTSLSKDLQKRSFKSNKTVGCHQSRTSSNVLKDITNIAHLRKTKCSERSSTFNASTESIEEENGLVGTDLWIIDTDSEQVFDCSSLENTDSENDESDLDDPMDFESEYEPNEIINKNPNSSVGVLKAPKSSPQTLFGENEQNV